MTCRPAAPVYRCALPTKNVTPARDDGARGKVWLTASFFTLSLMGTCLASKSFGKSLMMLLGIRTLGPYSLQMSVCGEA